MADEVNVSMAPAFKRAYKKMHPNQKAAVNKAVNEIIKDPAIGTEKQGDLKGVFVYKFSCVGVQMLLAYEWLPMERLLLALGVHENFYRDLKR